MSKIETYINPQVTSKSILASKRTNFDEASAISNLNSKRRKGVLGSRGEAKRGNPPPVHFPRDKMVADILDRELISITREHMKNICTAG